MQWFGFVECGVRIPQEKEILIGPSFGEPVRIETVSREADGSWSLGVVGARSERFRRVVLSPEQLEQVQILTPAAAAVRARCLGSDSESAAAAAGVKGRRLAAHHAAEALKYLRQDMPELAVREATESVKHDSDCMLAYYSQGLACLALGRARDAREALRRACRLAPLDASVWIARGFAALELADKEDARTAFETVARYSPKHSLLLDQAQIEAYCPLTATAAEIQAPQVSLCRLVARLLKKQDAERIEIRAWLCDLPPWSWIERAPLPKALGGFAIALALFLLMTISNYPRLDARLVAKFAVVATVCFLGCLYPFLGSHILKRYYGILERSVLIPGDAFKRWYLSELSGFWGRTSLRLLYEQTPGGAAENRSRRAGVLSALRRLLSEDTEIVVAALAVFAGLLPLQYACIDDPLRLTPGVLVHYAMAAVEAWLLGWSIHFSIRSFLFVFRLTGQPARYFAGIPYEISMAPVGQIYLWFGVLSAVGFACFLLQHYVYATYRHMPIANVVFVTLVAAAILVLTVAPQVAVFLAVRRMKAAELVQFSGSVERSFGEFLRDPTPDTRAAVQRRLDDFKFLKRNLPVMRLLWPNAWVVPLCGLQIAVLVLYVWGVYRK